MELTEICGRMHLQFEDFVFGLSVCSETVHNAFLDCDSELSFHSVAPQYFKLMKTAIDLHRLGKAFDLYFSVSGNGLVDPPSGEPWNLYYCRVQGWSDRLAVELVVPGKQALISQECNASDVRLNRAINFAFGGFIFTCLDFNIKEIDLNNIYISEALELYCLADDKQTLLSELFLDD